jgi:hypothetical protein
MRKNCTNAGNEYEMFENTQIFKIDRTPAREESAQDYAAVAYQWEKKTIITLVIHTFSRYADLNACVQIWTVHAKARKWPRPPISWAISAHGQEVHEVWVQGLVVYTILLVNTEF